VQINYFLWSQTTPSKGDYLRTPLLFTLL